MNRLGNRMRFCQCDAFLSRLYSVLSIQDRACPVRSVCTRYEHYTHAHRLLSFPPIHTHAPMLHTGKLAFDGTSPAVRVAVLQGALKLLDNPLAQPILKVHAVHAVHESGYFGTRVRVSCTCIQHMQGLL